MESSLPTTPQTAPAAAAATPSNPECSIEQKLKNVILKKKICAKLTNYLEQTPTNQLELLINYINLLYKKYKMMTINSQLTDSTRNSNNEPRSIIKNIEPEEIQFLVLFYDYVDKKIINDRSKQSTNYDYRTATTSSSSISMWKSENEFISTMLKNSTNIIMDLKNVELLNDLNDFLS